MRYFGSKSSTVNSLYNLISARIPKGTFCDPFGGIGVVGSFFKGKGYSVWSGDILLFAYYFQVARIVLDDIPSFRSLREKLNLESVSDIIRLLNTTEIEHGWFFNEYAIKRQFFTTTNAKRIESCWIMINRWAEEKLVDDNEYAFLVASLIDSMDRVANTAGTYYAYLKTWTRKALRSFRYTMLPYTQGNEKCQSYRYSAEDLVSKRHYNVLYLDPPYNDRSYAHYYHLPETVAHRTKPIVHGMAGIPTAVGGSSDFNRVTRAKYSLEELLQLASFDLLVFHYSDGGIIGPDELRGVFTPYGKVEEYIIESKGYTVKKIPRKINHRIYIVGHG